MSFELTNVSSSLMNWNKNVTTVTNITNKEEDVMMIIPYEKQAMVVPWWSSSSFDNHNEEDDIENMPTMILQKYHASAFITETMNLASIVIITETFDSFGNTDPSRLFSFYCSESIPACVNTYETMSMSIEDVFGQSGTQFDIQIPFQTFDIMKSPENENEDGDDDEYAMISVKALGTEVNVASVMVMTMALVGLGLIIMALHKVTKQRNQGTPKPFASQSTEEAELDLTPSSSSIKQFRPYLPPLHVDTIEYISDLRDARVFSSEDMDYEINLERGRLVGDYSVSRVRDTMNMQDVNAQVLINKHEDNISKQKPVLRLDQTNYAMYGDEDAEHTPFILSHKPSQKDHSQTISQLPAKYPGGPRLRLEKTSPPVISRRSSTLSSNGNSLDEDFLARFTSFDGNTSQEDIATALKYALERQFSNSDISDINDNNEESENYGRKLMNNFHRSNTLESDNGENDDATVLTPTSRQLSEAGLRNRASQNMDRTEGSGSMLSNERVYSDASISERIASLNLTDSPTLSPISHKKHVRKGIIVADNEYPGSGGGDDDMNVYGSHTPTTPPTMPTWYPQSEQINNKILSRRLSSGATRASTSPSLHVWSENGNLSENSSMVQYILSKSESTEDVHENENVDDDGANNVMSFGSHTPKTPPDMKHWPSSKIDNEKDQNQKHSKSVSFSKTPSPSPTKNQDFDHDDEIVNDIIQNNENDHNSLMSIKRSAKQKKNQNKSNIVDEDEDKQKEDVNKKVTISSVISESISDDFLDSLMNPSPPPPPKTPPKREKH